MANNAERNRALRKHISTEDIAYMSDVEAALHRQCSPWTYKLSMGIVLLFAAFLVFSFVAERDEITRGEGHIILSRGVQPIQSVDGGIITEILVRENQEVEKDTIVARISNIRAIAEYHELQNKQIEYRLALLRLAAEDRGGELGFSEEDARRFPNVVRDQTRLFVTRKQQFDSEGRELMAQLEQRRQEVAQSQSRRAQYQESLLLMKRQEEQVRPLVGRAYSEIDYLNLKQRIVSQEGELNSLAQTISQAQSAVREAEEKLKNREAEMRTKIAEEMNKTRQQLDAVEEGLKGRSAKVSRTDLKVPMRSVVKRILLKQDSVARAAETILEVLPLDDSLEVEARFRPADRGFIAVGQSATIKITAYDYSIYGGLSGEVTSISADTIEDNKGQPWYSVRLRALEKALPGKQDLEMKVGMTVTVDVHSGSKSIFDYLMKPILKSRQMQNVIRADATNATVPEGPVANETTAPAGNG